MDDPILVVGAGPIGSEYIKVLRRQGCRAVDVLTRSEASAEAAAARLSPRRALSGGYPRLAAAGADYRAIFIDVPVDDLLDGLRVVAEHAPRADVLIEKPVALNSAALQRFIRDFPGHRAMAALNRLYFPSVTALHRRLAQDAALSGRFCFTEWVHRIPTERFSKSVLARWGMANSIHLISAFFDVLGAPERLESFVDGAEAIAWHPTGARFYGAGRTATGLPFAYDADWQSGGRYAIEIFTAAGCYALKPLHQLTFTARGTVDEDVLEPPYQGALKCGFEGLVQAFLAGAPETRERLGLPRLLRHLQTVEAIFRYPPPAGA